MEIKAIKTHVSVKIKKVIFSLHYCNNVMTYNFSLYLICLSIIG